MIEEYCEECKSLSDCNGKCTKHRATATCAAPGCYTRIVYPAGTKRPKYCREHMIAMMVRLSDDGFVCEESFDELYRCDEIGLNY